MRIEYLDVTEEVSYLESCSDFWRLGIEQFMCSQSCRIIRFEDATPGRR